MNKRKPITVGLSGGVDSAVTAALLKQQGYDVSAVFMQNWRSDDPHCTASEDLSDAQAVCDTLGIALDVLDLSATYWDKVFAACLDEFACGRTPNPDIWCNKYVKFDAFLAAITAQKDCRLATGHYARIVENDGQYELHKGVDGHKDQSYFLYALNQQQLSQSCFPLGDYEKTAVRTLAKQLHLPNASKKDSTGICFIGERRFKPFLQDFLKSKPGVILTSDGQEIGKHDGAIFYTLGQRKGLNIGGVKNQPEAPWYVVAKDNTTNTVTVAQEHNHPLLMRRTCSLEQLHWINDRHADNGNIQCMAKTRYRQADQACQVVFSGTEAQITFEEAQRAITPGQSVVLYRETQCLGGGIIKD